MTLVDDAADAPQADANLALTYPMQVTLETVMGCNAACIMCPVVTSPRKRELMKDALFRKLVDEMAAWPQFPVIALHGLGEPLMDNTLEDKIRYLHNRGCQAVEISTNASLLDRKRAIVLAQARPDILTLSLESFDRATYEAIRVNLDFETVTENIRNFINQRNRVRLIPGRPTSIHLLFVYHDDNAAHLRPYIDLWYPMLSAIDSIRIYSRHNFGGITASSHPASNAPCKHLGSTLQVLADGRVAMCFIDTEAEHQMGDTNRQTLLEIWNDQPFSDRRRAHATGGRKDVSMCAGCNAPEAGNFVIPGAHILDWIDGPTGGFQLIVRKP